MIIEDDTRIRVIRAYMGMNSKTFCETLGISPATLTNWEKKRSTPTRKKRRHLAELCQKWGLAFLPSSGMPVPASDFMATNETPI